MAGAAGTVFNDIQCKLQAHPAELLLSASLKQSAVALILRMTATGPEMLFIERASRNDDPWSGNLGFPGGKVEAGDMGERQAAERETWEEIGLDLSTARYLGRLSDIVGAHLPIRVSCFVYGVESHGSLSLNEEVQTAFWVPLTILSEPERHLESMVNFSEKDLLAPVIRILEPDRPLLWGITFRLVTQFLQILGSSPGDECQIQILP